MKNIKPEGKCYYCKETFAGNSISRHINSHLKTIEKDNQSKKKSYHIKITGDYFYFLNLLISENTTLNSLDTYLRKIWLECCGHLSSFEIKGKQRIIDIWSDSDDYGINMDTKVGHLFKKGLKLNYQYDFGSTTNLEIKIVNEYFLEDKKSNILLLSRNEPLNISCDLCKKKPAQVMCILWHDNETMFCNSCKKKHSKKCDDFADYGEMDIVNSPRMGVCGYDGGSIDLKRDGVWKG